MLAGDLNSRPESIEMRLLGLLLPGLRDCWQQACSQALPGFTSNLESNTFREPSRPLSKFSTIIGLCELA